MIAAQTILSLTNLVIGLAELLIGLRVLLKFFGANPVAPFVSWVYQTSDSLLSPFQGMFPVTHLPVGFTIEFSALFGLLIYALFGYILAEVIGFFEVRRELLVERLRSKKG